MALSGANFPAEMKQAGYDMIVIERKAEKPTYPVIDKSGASFRSAANLVGMMTLDKMTDMGIPSIKNRSATGEINTVPTLGEKAQDTMIITKCYCYDCPVACSQVKLVTSGPYAGYLSESPGFETTYSLGSS